MVVPKINLEQRLREFADYINGKSVAIVGRASYLVHSEWGKEIDEFDVVVRIHSGNIHGCPSYDDYLPEKDHLALSDKRYIPPFYQRHVGSKTSVLYLRLQWLDYDILNHTLEILKRDGADWIGVETFWEMAYASAQYHYVDQHWERFHVIPIDFFHDVSARLHYVEPLPGTTIAAFLAWTQATQIKIFGCPCYQDKDGKKEQAKLTIMARHNTLADFHYIKQLVERDPRIECDPVMSALFGEYVT